MAIGISLDEGADDVTVLLAAPEASKHLEESWPTSTPRSPPSPERSTSTSMTATASVPAAGDAGGKPVTQRVVLSPSDPDVV